MVNYSEDMSEISTILKLKDQLIEFCHNIDFILYRSCFPSVKGCGWIRERGLGTASVIAMSSTGPANVWGLLLSCGGWSESKAGGSNAGVKPCSDISFHSRYRKMELWKGFSETQEILVCSSPQVRQCLVGSMSSWVPVNHPLVHFTHCIELV